MKKIAIVGGLESDLVSLYRNAIIDQFKSDVDSAEMPEILIERIDLDKLLSDEDENKWDRVIAVIADKFNDMQRSGADIGVIASSAPHKVFKHIQNKTSLLLICMVVETCKAAQRLELIKPALFGSKFVMESGFYQKIFKKVDIDVVVPNERDQILIQEKLSTELEKGIFKSATKEVLLDIVDQMSELSIDGLVLACPELSRIINKNDIDIAYLDSTQIHIDRIVEYCKSL